MSTDTYFNLSNNPTNNYTFLPIYNHKYYEFYKKQLSTFWTVEEIDLSKDRYDELLDDEKKYLKNILAFFAISDGLVIDNLATNFLNEVEILEAQYFYGHQTFIEQVHANAYSLLIESYIENENEKLSLFNSMETNQAVLRKAGWGYF